MRNNGIAEQVNQNLVNASVIPGLFLGDKAAKRVPAGAKPGRKFVEFNISPLRMYDVIICIDRINDLPDSICFRSFIHGFDRIVIVKRDVRPPRRYTRHPTEPFKECVGVCRLYGKSIVGTGAKEID